MRLRNKQKLVLPDVEYKTLRRRRRVRKPQQNDCRANDALDDIIPRDKFRIHSLISLLFTQIWREEPLCSNVLPIIFRFYLI